MITIVNLSNITLILWIFFNRYNKLMLALGFASYFFVFIYMIIVIVYYYLFEKSVPYQHKDAFLVQLCIVFFDFLHHFINTISSPSR